MTTTNKNKSNAEAAYKAKKTQIEKTLKDIAKALKDFDKDSAGRKEEINYGHVGSLEFAAYHLSRIEAYLSGRDDD